MHLAVQQLLYTIGASQNVVVPDRLLVRCIFLLIAQSRFVEMSDCYTGLHAWNERDVESRQTEKAAGQGVEVNQIERIEARSLGGEGALNF